MNKIVDLRFCDSQQDPLTLFYFPVSRRKYTFPYHFSKSRLTINIRDFREIYVKPAVFGSLCTLAYTPVFKQFKYHLSDKH